MRSSDLQIRRHPAWLGDVDAGDDDDLVQREGDALTQLIRAVERVGEEPVLDRIDACSCRADTSIRSGTPRYRASSDRAAASDSSRRRLELLVQELLEADALDVRDELGGRSPGGLLEEPGGIGRGHLRRGDDLAEEPLLVCVQVAKILDDRGTGFSARTDDVEGAAAVPIDQRVVAVAGGPGERRPGSCGQREDHESPASAHRRNRVRHIPSMGVPGNPNHQM